MNPLQRIASVLLPKRFYCEDGLISAHQHAFMGDLRFNEAYDYAVKATGTDPQNKWRIRIALWCFEQALKVEGSLVELVVNYGFTSAAILHYFRPLQRNFWLVDSWDRPGYNNDVTRLEGRGPCQRILVGNLPAAANRITAQKIAFIHFDLNDGVAEVESFSILKYHLCPGSVVLLDDYNYAGFEKTRREWDKLRINIMPLPTGQWLVVM